MHCSLMQAPTISQPHTRPGLRMEPGQHSWLLGRMSGLGRLRFAVRKSENQGQNESKRTVCAGSSACATFRGNVKGKLMCWNAISTDSRREAPDFSSQLSQNAANLELVLRSLPPRSGFALLSAANKARDREGNLQSSKSPS